MMFMYFIDIAKCGDKQRLHADRFNSEEPSLSTAKGSAAKKYHVMPSANKFKGKNSSSAAGEDSDTGLSSLHSSTSSDEGNTTVVGSNSSNDGVAGVAEDGDFGTLV